MGHRQVTIGRGLGITFIVALWLTAAYLFLITGLLSVVPANQLHGLLGDYLYNTLFPGTIVVSMLILLVWAPLTILVSAAVYLLIGVFSLRDDRPKRILASLLSSITIAIVMHLAVLDGWPGTLAAWTLGHDTEYAPGYSPFGFWSVRIGMTEAEVVTRVGEPMGKSAHPLQPNTDYWWWTRSPGSNNYRSRRVAFRDGRVVIKQSSFYCD